ncbi:zinc finger protein 471-like isoform X1 [Lytechinus pictus]|uniref:zinc finger protein 471-like isoform X1 n=2 Tax=Lytechinus pictus TaxID=7653 RepID=UPI0030BA13FC
MDNSAVEHRSDSTTHHGEEGQRSSVNERWVISEIETPLRSTVHQTCPTETAQYANVLAKEPCHSQLQDQKRALDTPRMSKSEVLHHQRENHFIDNDQDLGLHDSSQEHEENQDSYMLASEQSGRPDSNMEESEDGCKNQTRQGMIPLRPLHKTLKTKGDNQHVRKNKGTFQQNDWSNQGEMPRSLPFGTVESADHRLHVCANEDKDPVGDLGLQLHRDIVGNRLEKTPKALHLQGRGLSKADGTILQSGLTSKNSRMPSLDKIVNKLRTVKESEEASSVAADAEPDKDSFLHGVTRNIPEKTNTSRKEQKRVGSGVFQSKDRDKLSKKRKISRGQMLQPTKTGKSVENDLAEKKCLVVESLVVGEAFVGSASGGIILEKPPGQQCAVCKEYVPQANLNSHRCKVGISKTKTSVGDIKSSGRSQKQNSYLCKNCQRPVNEGDNKVGKQKPLCGECDGREDQTKCVDVSEDVLRGIHKCTQCEESFNSRSSLSLHLLTHVQVKLIRCDVCDKICRTEGMLATHKRIHAGQHPYQCHICDKTFGKSNTLTCHLRTHSGEKPYRCDLCDKSFTQNSALTVHKRIHSGEQPYCCSICGKNFRDSSNLRRHVRIHSGDQPFECSVCEKRFSTKDHLSTHFRIHTGDKPYQCYVCDKAFTQSSTLVGHMKTHAENTPYKCNVCQEGFRDKRKYSSHMNLHAEETNT